MAQEISKMDPRLAWIIKASVAELKLRAHLDRDARREGRAPFLHGVRLRASGEYTVSVLIWFTSPNWLQAATPEQDDGRMVERDRLEELGVVFRSFSYAEPGGRHVVTANVPGTVLSRILSNPLVQFVELSAAAYMQLDESVLDIKADLVQQSPKALTGKGTVIGVIDVHPIAFHHPTFRKIGVDGAPGDTRILRIWDQSAASLVDGAQVPYGKEYTAADLNNDLAAAVAYDIVPYPAAQMDAGVRGNHGTHVTGIAAGNGNAPEDRSGMYIGVAPEADIIFVNVTAAPHPSSPWVVLDDDEASDDAAPGAVPAYADLSSICDAIFYIFNRAGSAPCVINISLGDNLGSHDGTNLAETFIDNMLASTGANLAGNRAVVIAAGNGNDRGQHACGNVMNAGQATLEFVVGDSVGYIEALRIYYSAGFGFLLTVIAPDQSSVQSYFVQCAMTTVPLDGGGSVGIVARVNDGRHPDNVVELSLQPPSSGVLLQGVWQIKIVEISAKDGIARYDAWLDDNSGMRWVWPRTFGTLTSLATCRSAIAVGNYQSPYNAPYSVSTTSGRGPTRDLRQKPDLVAPGCGITSAFWLEPSRPRTLYWFTGLGTSLAAPHVAGLVALILEGNGNSPGLSVEQIKERLQQAADRSGFCDDEQQVNYGWGRARADRS